MSFLAYIFHKENCNYGVIAVARSALSAILPLKEGKTFGECPKVSKMLKGIFKQRPTFPKYTVVYNPDIILTYMDTLSNNVAFYWKILQKSCALCCVYLVAKVAKQ